jgi:lipopolysaccharide biosynthesis glycosyltransferase
LTQNEKAQTNLQESVKIREELFKDNEQVAKSYFASGVLAKNQKDQSFEEVFTKCLNIRKNLLGLDHPLTLEVNK